MSRKGGGMADKMRMVFIGLGKRAMAYATPAAKDSRFEITAVGDPDPTHYKKHAGIFGAARYYEDWRQLLDKEPFDLACVCPPDYLHEEIALAILERGKHLLLEKPMALTPDGCLRILSALRAQRAQRKAGTKMIIGFVLRYNNLYTKTRELILNGAIGTVKAAWVEHSVTLNYFHNWMSRRRMSGGLLLQKASHDIDLVNWMVGSAPLKVSAFASLDYFGGEKDDRLVCPDCGERDTCPESVARGGRKDRFTEMGEYGRQQKLCAFRKEN